MLVGTHAEVLNSLTSVLRSTEEEGVASGRSAESKLIQGEDLTTGGQDAGAGSGGEAEGGDAQLGDGQETVVVGDGADDDDGLVVGLLGDVGDDPGERHGGPVDAGHEEAAEDDLVEGRLGAAWFCRLAGCFLLLGDGGSARVNLRAKKR